MITLLFKKEKTLQYEILDFVNDWQNFNHNTYFKHFYSIKSAKECLLKLNNIMLELELITKYTYDDNINTINERLELSHYHFYFSCTNWKFGTNFNIEYVESVLNKIYERYFNINNYK